MLRRLYIMDKNTALATPKETKVTTWNKALKPPDVGVEVGVGAEDGEKDGEKDGDVDKDGAEDGEEDGSGVGGSSALITNRELCHTDS
mmetsp:Transcript_16832/g.20207  ORF Transcript_16832/g.20207 Transcript_16832/m.20207 type:complete len:88 (-) Transcript_16832:537-800(-)